MNLATGNLIIGHVAGVDTHADTHTLAVLTAQGAVVCTEEFTVVEVLRPSRHVRRRSGKSDPVDAIAAARQVLTRDGTSTPKNTNSSVEALRYLLTTRRNLIGAASRMITVIKSLLVTAPKTVRAPLRALATPALVATLASCRPGTDMADPATAAKHTLRLLARDYRHLHAEADRLEDQMSQLVTAVNPGMLEVFGSGIITGTQLLVAAGDNPVRIATEAQLAYLCGAAPIPASSGKTRRYRLNRGGDRRANNALHRIALVRMRHDPRTRAYVQRRSKENLSKKEILRCLKRAIVREIHHVLLAPPTAVPADLRRLRKQKRITLTQAAQALNTWPARLSDIERKTRPLPDLTDRYQTWLTAA